MTVTDDKNATIHLLTKEVARLLELKTPASRELLNITKGCLDNAEAEIEQLRAVIIRYLDFAKDVGVSPVAPELRPIREAMRAAIADGERSNWRTNNDHYDGTADGDKDWG